jgi:hypothetical protein
MLIINIVALTLREATTAKKADVQKQVVADLQPPDHAGSSLPDFSILKMEAILSSKTSVHTRFTQRQIPEDNNIPSNLSAVNFSETSVNFYHIIRRQIAEHSKRHEKPTPILTSLVSYTDECWVKPDGECITTV